VLPTTIAAWALALASLIAVGAIVVAAIAIVRVRLDSRPQSPGPARAIALGAGYLIGLAMALSEAAPPARLALVIAAGLVTLAGLTAGRSDLAGLFLIGASIGWLVVGAAVLFADLVRGIRMDPARVVPSMVVAAIALAVGVILWENRRRIRSMVDREAAERRPLTPGEARRWNTVSLSIGDPLWFEFPPNELAATAVLVLGAVVTVTAAHGRSTPAAIVVAAIGVASTAGAAGLAAAFVRSRRSRRAFEPWAWLGEWELARVAALNHCHAMTDRRAFRRYLRTVGERPDDRWFRVDVLAIDGRLPEARAIALRMPEDTAYQRVERAAGLAFVDWLGGGSGDPTDLRAAVADVRPLDGDDRVRAEVVAAIHEVRLRAGRSEPDPAFPLRAVRDRVGSRADRQLLVFARRMVRAFTPVAVLIVGGATALDHLALLR